MSADFFGNPTTTINNNNDNLKAKDKLIKIDINKVKNNVSSNSENIDKFDNELDDHLIRIKYLEQELTNSLIKQKQDIITKTKEYMNNETFEQLKVKSIAYVSDNQSTQITNYNTFQNKIDYIENGIRELETYITFVKNEMQRKYNILDKKPRRPLIE